MMKHIFSVAAILAVVSSPSFAASIASAPLPSGTWKVAGDVQGVPVNLSCTLTETEGKLSGACVDDQNKSHLVTGEVKDKVIFWAFNTEYEGSPITVNLAGTLDATGAKMSGTIAVDPMQVDGQFSATLQPPATPSAPTN
jgi:hypothetical protein